MNSCRLCNSSFIRNWTAKDAKTGDTLMMALCGGCGLVQQSTLPTDEELKIYYSHNYREDYKSTHQPKLKYVYRAGLAAKDRLAFIERAGIQMGARRLLDIGAGGGEFCYLASKAGFAAQGIEPHPGPATAPAHASTLRTLAMHRYPEWLAPSPPGTPP